MDRLTDWISHLRCDLGLMGLFPQPFIDDLRLQANILQVVQEYVPAEARGQRPTRGCARFTPRRRRRSPSIPRRASSTASAARPAATSSSSWSCTRRSGFRTRCGCSRRSSASALPESATRRRSAARRGAARIAAQDSRGGRGVLPRTARGPAGARARQQLKDRGGDAADDRAARARIRPAGTRRPEERV